MAYSLELHRTRVVPYLRDREGSREFKLRLFANLQQLKETADHYISDPIYRFPPESDCFLYDLVLLDGKIYRRFWFIVNASGAKYGVLSA